jgi:hypothetical protein
VVVVVEGMAMSMAMGQILPVLRMYNMLEMDQHRDEETTWTIIIIIVVAAIHGVVVVVVVIVNEVEEEEEELRLVVEDQVVVETDIGVEETKIQRIRIATIEIVDKATVVPEMTILPLTTTTTLVMNAMR